MEYIPKSQKKFMKDINKIPFDELLTKLEVEYADT